MAMPAAARRSEPHSAKLQTDLGASISPLRTTKQAASSRASTPRPSISPLSTASKMAGSSPSDMRDALSHEAVSKHKVEETNGANGSLAGLQELDDDRSSSLSEPDEDPDEEMHIHTAAKIRRPTEDATALPSHEADSEAETERLEETPNHRRRRATSVEKTPSKLIQSALIDDDLSDPPSPLPIDPGGVSYTSELIIGGKKRKRSDDEESPLTSNNSELGQSPRKRSHDLASLEAMAENEEDSKLTVEESIEPANPMLTEPQDHAATTPSRTGRSKRGKLKGRSRKESVQEQEGDAIDTTVVAEEEIPDDDVAKSSEEIKHKQAASSLYEDLAKRFTTFRDKLYNERLANLTAELDMLNQSNCQHPDFLRMVTGVDSRYAKQVSEAQAFQKYKMQALRRTTLAERSQIFSQYYQTARELREDIMYKLSEDWYNIQKERRQFGQDQDDAYLYKFTNKKSEQLRQQAKYNQEVSILSGFAKYVGFPAAPEISGLEGSALEDDLKNMKLIKRPQPSSAHPHAMNWALAQGKSERLAHEQFIEQHAWARPQESMLLHATPNLKNTPIWTDSPAPNPPPASNTLPSLNGNPPSAPRSPYTTPLPPRRTAPIELSSAGTIPANSDPIDPPSSAIAAPPTAPSERLPFPPSSATRDPPSPLNTHPKHRPQQQLQPPGSITSDLPGWRNLSQHPPNMTPATDAPSPSADRSLANYSHTAPPPGDPAPPLRHSLFDAAGPSTAKQQQQQQQSQRPPAPVPPSKQPDIFASAPGFRAHDGGSAY